MSIILAEVGISKVLQESIADTAADTCSRTSTQRSRCTLGMLGGLAEGRDAGMVEQGGCVCFAIFDSTHFDFPDQSAR